MFHSMSMKLFRRHLFGCAGEEMTKEQKVSIHNLWVGKWGHLTQSKLLRVPNSLGAPGKWADTMKKLANFHFKYPW